MSCLDFCILKSYQACMMAGLLITVQYYLKGYDVHTMLAWYI